MAHYLQRIIVMKTVEVAIVGASLTGSALAYSLGNKEIEVCLIDKSDFPRRKACGEGLSSIGESYLRKLNLSWIFDQNLTHTVPYVPLNGYGINIWNTRIQLPVFGKSKGIAKGLERNSFDFAVFSAAAKLKSVTSILNQRVHQIDPETGVIKGDGIHIKAKHIILAAGPNHPLKENNLPDSNSNRFGLSLHCQSATPHQLSTVEIYTFRGFQLFVTPVSHSRLNISALGSQAAIKNLAKEDMNPAISHVAKALRLNLQPCTPLMGAGPFGAKAKSRRIGRVILAGDSHQSLDPVGGMGMTQALITAFHLGNTLIEIQNSTVRDEIAFNKYAGEMLVATRQVRAFTMLAKTILDSIFSKIAPQIECDNQQGKVNPSLAI